MNNGLIHNEGKQPKRFLIPSIVVTAATRENINVDAIVCTAVDKIKVLSTTYSWLLSVILARDLGHSP